MQNDLRVVFVGDVFGRPGRDALKRGLETLRASEPPDIVIVNCENSAAGFGLTDKVMREMFDLGVDVMTSGNHIWDKKEFVPLLNQEPRVLRPANYPAAAPGRGWCTVERAGVKICVISLQGRAFMPAEVASPFETADNILSSEDADIALVDFHAEATAEKIALARYLDGRVSAIVGTHTHVPTADETIMPGGTAYMTDIGMTGGHGGVIGARYDSVLPRFLTSVPCKFEVDDTDVRFQGVVVEIDKETSRAVSIKRYDMRLS